MTKPEIGGADENLTAARARLLTEIHSERRPARARAARRPWIIAAGLVGAAAAVTAGVLVVGTLTAPTPAPSVEAIPTRAPGTTFQPTPTPQPTPEPATAASVLVGAAHVAATSEGPVAGPGQYLKIEHHLRQLQLYSPDDPLNSTRAQATAGWVATSSYTSYIPADPGGEWVDVFHPDLEVVELYGDEAEARSQEWLANFSWNTEPMIQRYPGNPEPEEAGPNALLARYPELPRDPAELIAWIRGYQVGLEPGTEDMAVVTFLMQELQLGAAPADLRSAMFRALSLMPNGVISETEGSIVTLTFPTQPSMERWDSISVDTRTALVTSVSMTYGSGGQAVPDSIPNYVTTQTAVIVDSAP